MKTDLPYLDTLSPYVDNIKIILTYDQVIKLTHILENNMFAVPTLKELDKINISPSARDKLIYYLKNVGNENDIKAIMLSLINVTRIENNYPLEICWTGPCTDSHIRMTWPALSEIILGANENIIIVGYSITSGMEEIMDYLIKKSNEGVRLIFMIDRIEEKKEFLNWLKKLKNPFEIYNRPRDPNDPLSSLHVKCIVIDEKIAMFGSANLTYHGMKSNMELGLIIKDKKIVNKIIQLINNIKTQLVLIENK